MRIPILLALLAAPVPALAQGAGSPEAASGVIQTYYAAIDRGNFRGAYRLWNGDGRASGKSFASFRQGFAATARTRVTTGTPRNGDAGMSQRWIDVPVDIRATLKNGKRQHFTGYYRLHRIVEGVSANPADSQWRIASAKLVAAR
ncbi:MAG: hypothetical protein EOP59_18430 [Sphingomonadales bacterium]|nr:MAG: hypothetical protein EOP59_18430 [Sphingomonadales bacterium]